MWWGSRLHLSPTHTHPPTHQPQTTKKFLEGNQKFEYRAIQNKNENPFLGTQTSFCLHTNPSTRPPQPWPQSSLRLSSNISAPTGSKGRDVACPRCLAAHRAWRVGWGARSRDWWLADPSDLHLSSTHLSPSGGVNLHDCPFHSIASNMGWGEGKRHNNVAESDHCVKLLCNLQRTTMP